MSEREKKNKLEKRNKNFKPSNNKTEEWTHELTIDGFTMLISMWSSLWSWIVLAALINALCLFLQARLSQTGVNPVISVTSNVWAEWAIPNVPNLDRYWPLLSTWSATNGMWRFWQANGTIFLRGGHATSRLDWGLFSLAFYWSNASRHAHGGFRCAK